MSRSSFRTTALSTWFIALLLFVGVQVAGGSLVTIPALAIVTLLATIPPAVLMVALRTPPQPAIDQATFEHERRQTIAARLRTIEHQANRD